MLIIDCDGANVGILDTETLMYEELPARDFDARVSESPAPVELYAYHCNGYDRNIIKSENIVWHDVAKDARAKLYRCRDYRAWCMQTRRITPCGLYSMTLESVYNYLNGSSTRQSHTCLGDCFMLYLVMQKLDNY